MDRSVSGGLLKGFDAATSGHSNVQLLIYYLQIEMLVFCHADLSQPAYLRQILIWFQVVSDHNINLRECEITSMEVVDNIEEIVQF